MDGGPVDLKQIPRIFGLLNKERKGTFHPFGDDKLKHVVKTLDTDKKAQLSLRRCAEPMITGDSSDDVNVLGIEEMIACGDLDSLLDEAIKTEKKDCSWEATIGPAVKAIKRLGRTSDGKDHEKLANYAKAHQKPAL